MTPKQARKEAEQFVHMAATAESEPPVAGSAACSPARRKPKFVQSISATGLIKTNGAAAIFCPEDGVENTDGIALLGIRIKPSTLERLSGERVTLVIYPAVRENDQAHPTAAKASVGGTENL